MSTQCAEDDGWCAPNGGLAPNVIHAMLAFSTMFICYWLRHVRENRSGDVDEDGDEDGDGDGNGAWEGRPSGS